ncbi:MAG TPA: GGDEF domain-containing protein [Dokdonella sp.]
MNFDIHTAMIVASLLTLGVGASLAFAALRYPAPLRDAMRVWIVGLLLQAFSLSAAGIFATLVPWLVVTSNTVYALAYAEMARAQRLFSHQPRRFSAAWPVAAIGLLSFAFAIVWPSSRWRIATTSVPIIALQSTIALSILRGRAELRPAAYLTATLFFACAALTALRGGVELAGPALVPAVVHDAVRDAALLFSSILPPLATIGFMLMCGDRLNEELIELAMVDPLTGAYNRRTLAGLAGRAIADARRRGAPLSLLAIDVDHFKRINDEFGHDVGDEALRHVVATIRAELAAHQVLSRIGGEEFAVLLPDADEDAACAIAERLRLRVARSPFVAGAATLTPHVSIGVVALGARTADLASLLREADLALYAAKRAGRDRIARFSALAADADTAAAAER